MTLGGTHLVDWTLPALLLLAWITLWAARRRVPTWFFAAGVLLAILCIPAGMFAGKAQLAGSDCTPDNLCFSSDEVDWWANGLFGFLGTGVLAFVTLVVTAVATLLRGPGKKT